MLTKNEQNQMNVKLLFAYKHLQRWEKKRNLGMGTDKREYHINIIK